MAQKLLYYYQEKKQGVTQHCVTNCVTPLKKLRDRASKSTIREDETSSSLIAEKALRNKAKIKPLERLLQRLYLV